MAWLILSDFFFSLHLPPHNSSDWHDVVLQQTQSLGSPPQPQGKAPWGLLWERGSSNPVQLWSERYMWRSVSWEGFSVPPVGVSRYKCSWTSCRAPTLGTVSDVVKDSGHHWLQNSPKKVGKLVVIIIQPTLDDINHHRCVSGCTAACLKPVGVCVHHNYIDFVAL